MVVAVTVDGAVRERDLGEVINSISLRRPGERRDPYSAASRFRAFGVDSLA